jgi:ketosteroid isomerase-like protein
MAADGSVVDKLQEAINSHQLDVLAELFTEDVVSEQPAHPDRGFRGLAQLRENWSRIFAGVPDLDARAVRTARSGDDAWVEWAWSGTGADQNPFAMRGVTILGSESDRISRVTFYMEPVQRDGLAVGEAIQQQLERR